MLITCFKYVEIKWSLALNLTFLKRGCRVICSDVCGSVCGSHAVSVGQHCSRVHSTSSCRQHGNNISFLHKGRALGLQSGRCVQPRFTKPGLEPSTLTASFDQVCQAERDCFPCTGHRSRSVSSNLSLRGQLTFNTIMNTPPWSSVAPHTGRAPLLLLLVPPQCFMRYRRPHRSLQSHPAWLSIVEMTQ